MTESLQRYLSAGVLTIWGVMLAYFYFSGRVASYLHPSFHVWTGISGVILVLLAAGLLFLSDGEDPCCEGCDHSHDSAVAAAQRSYSVRSRGPLAGGCDGISGSVRGGNRHQSRFHRKNQRSAQLQTFR